MAFYVFHLIISLTVDPMNAIYFYSWNSVPFIAEIVSQSVSQCAINNIWQAHSKKCSCHLFSLVSILGAVCYDISFSLVSKFLCYMVTFPFYFYFFWKCLWSKNSTSEFHYFHNYFLWWLTFFSHFNSDLCGKNFWDTWML